MDYPIFKKAEHNSEYDMIISEDKMLALRNGKVVAIGMCEYKQGVDTALLLEDSTIEEFKNNFNEAVNKLKTFIRNDGFKVDALKELVSQI